MSSVSALAPAIRSILMDPGTDLSSVSAKRVRKQLVSRRKLAISEDFVQEHKEEIDELIGRVFETVSVERGGVDAAPSPPSSSQQRTDEVVSSPAKRKRGHSNEYEDGTEMEDDTIPAKKPKAKSRSLTDEELARQLSVELNSNPSRRSGGKPAGRSPKKVKKSRDTIDDDSDALSDGSDGGRPAKKKSSWGKKKSTNGTSTGGGAKGGYQKELILSQELGDVCHTDRLSRPQVVKRLWEYIREHKLQNPENRKKILCDTKLRAVFKQDSVDMFTMNNY
ncbi:SWIB-domain-containing protein [Auriculariales sp. MPI-PUGE-AT-0066]|nr:SWIB-domain-containing protein [Auriculariales sp. MPI-PUGE-AT-0066]